MNTRIKVVKRNRTTENANKSQEQPPPNKTRDMVNTVKSWIAELNERKRIQPHVFSPLPVAATSPVHVATFQHPTL